MIKSDSVRLSNGETLAIKEVGSGIDRFLFSGNRFTFELFYHPAHGFAIAGAQSDDPTFSAFGMISKIPNITKYILTHRLLTEREKRHEDPENLFELVIPGTVMDYPLKIGHISSTYMLVPRDAGKPTGPKQSAPITTEYLIIYKEHATVLTYQRGIGYGIISRPRDNPMI
jgi:hypothetical protein